ncbi:DUF7287 family protein [Archaeoglobus fulgidus]|jgi:hypothetical protein|uniref:Uncharacterized protein AF_0763 n=2 Tax=Archaeoglobus fulgidus TaxID=2234 RepID=Y763_ARCFU|nr:hypothetical protein [Archaeoglobus fulgidus]O29495.1 RecName: Full=Uncharacterized protein AF_0763 [Archaeoglobus fulgidus DSM 4304]AAB90482.1 predicted coding region AF_0763 [Archaeoglobus fulgidus DSM 4304]AIG97639.1 hypothetical protein AFULGI_00008440 [Archaeoglobus fulgidus DSM 8774]
MDNQAKLSLDLLLGLSIFLTTFLFVANFLPGIFADVRHEIALGSHAYRVAALLVEDPGYPDDWCTAVDTSNCISKEFRPGLAIFDENNGTEYNYLNTSKIFKLQELLSNSACRDTVRNYLGLNSTNFKYKFYFSLKYLNDTEIVSGGDNLPEMGNIIKFDRLVYVDNCTAIPCESIAERCVCKLEVAVWI